MGGTRIPWGTNDEAGRLKRNLDATVAGLRGRKDLGVDGRRIHIGAATHHVKVRLREDRAAKVQAAIDEKARLEAEFYHLPRGNDSAVGLYRAALDRCESIKTAGEAAKLFDRAVRTGDSTMLRAIGFTAAERNTPMERGWGDLIGRYADTVPGGRAILDQLIEIDATSTPGHRLADDAEYGVVLAPELAGVSDTQLAHFAALVDQGTADGAA